MLSGAYFLPVNGIYTDLDNSLLGERGSCMFFHWIVHFSIWENR